MARLTTAFLLSLLASVALAAPKLKHKHHHHRGTGTGSGYPIPTGTGSPYSINNTTWYGPTGTAFPSIPVVFSTVYVSPLPASDATMPASSVVAASVVAAKAVAPNSVVPCGLPPVTVTASSTLTVTVAGSSAAAAASSSVVSVIPGPPYSIANATASGPTGPTGSDGPTAYPKWTAPLVSPPAASSSSAAALPASSSSSSSSTVAYTPPVYTPPAPVSSSSSAAAYTPSAVSSTTITTPSSSSPVAAYTPPASTFTTSTAVSLVATPPPARPVAPPTTSAVATPASPVSGAKRGVVYNTATLCGPFASSTAISWGYNWAASSGGLASSLNFIPMLWGMKGMQDTFVSDATVALANTPAGEKFIFGFNEPDESSNYGGSDLSTSDAATNWMKYIETPFAGQGIKFGSPAVTNANSTSPLMGAAWLDQFIHGDCKACTIDFVVGHWYGWAGGSAQEQATEFQRYVLAFQAQFSLPVWITEFSALPLDDQATNAAFMEIVLPWLDQQSSSVVGRYSYFMVSDGALVNGGQLSQMGQAYLAG
ncbi:hypothetical protein MMC26_001176 [Xylographa opegraphella]|nr:hypothetical protein [Xylographa opegraphella]